MGTGPVLYTGNNVDIYLDGILYGFVETLTISRSVNRSPQYVVGSPVFADAPITQALVTVQATNLVPMNGSSALSDTGYSGNQTSLFNNPNAPANDNVPTGSLIAEVNAQAYDITVQDQQGNVLWTVINAFFNGDAVTVPGTAVLTYNISWTAQDTSAWQV